MLDIIDQEQYLMHQNVLNNQDDLMNVQINNEYSDQELKIEYVMHVEMYDLKE
jgi:hypothetical protein